MLIESRLSEGHKIRCAKGHVFVVRALGPSVECPQCGETALSTDLATAFFLDHMATPAIETKSDGSKRG